MSDYIAEIIFQSTLSMRRATFILQPHDIILMISIHALHEESDAVVLVFVVKGFYFNPRSP